MSSDSLAAPTRRNPAQTRDRLIQAGFEEIYRCGIRGSDLNAILDKAGVTKGALYHHFDGKDALSHAAIEQVVGHITQEKWLTPLREAERPLDTLIAIVEGTFVDDDHACGGCPLNNLAQEMSAVGPEFQERVAGLFTAWIDGVTDALTRAQGLGHICGDIHPREQALFMIAAYEGYMTLAKSLRSGAILVQGVQSLVRHLNSLRPGIERAVI